MTNKIIGYIRTSTSSQDLGLEVQKKALERYEPDIIYSEKVSGRKANKTWKSVRKFRYRRYFTYL